MTDDAESAVEILTKLDEWCQKRSAKLTELCGSYVMSGGSLNAPKYRTMLGKHQEIMAMRSYIHGVRKRNLGGQP